MVSLKLIILLGLDRKSNEVIKSARRQTHSTLNNEREVNQAATLKIRTNSWKRHA